MSAIKYIQWNNGICLVIPVMRLIKCSESGRYCPLFGAERVQVRAERVRMTDTETDKVAMHVITIFLFSFE